MAEYQLLLPKMGESVAEATVIKWLKQPGDQIEEDETILEIATDKVDSEIPSPVKGKLIKQLFLENDIVQIGGALALIDIEDNSQADSAPVQEVDTPSVAESKEEKLPEIIDEEIIQKLEEPLASANGISDNNHQNQVRFYSPLVKNIAVEEGITLEELNTIPGTGAEGRVTKDDLLHYVKNRSKGDFSAPVKPVQTVGNTESAAISPAVSVSGGNEIIEMDRMRKLISAHMVMSKQTAPHVTSFIEADVTNLVRWRDRVKSSFEKREGEKITFTPVFIEAVAKAIKDFPMINISVNGNQIIKKKDINIGMATALPSGNLIVPVIKNADQLNLVGLTKAVNDLAKRARINKLQPDEVQDGTFTITNIGSFGNIMGTPIINQPQVAILAIGAIKKKPAVIETEFGDMIGIRHMMFLSMSYDHRVVDGMLGGLFIKKVSDYLEAWDVNREI